jgi:hypothetical protein
MKPDHPRKSNTRDYAPILIIGGVSLMYVMCVAWWYCFIDSQSTTTPPMIDNALNGVMVLLTGFAGVYAWKTVRHMQDELRQSQFDQQCQFLNSTLSSALDDFHRRYAREVSSEDKRDDPFLKSFVSVLNSSRADDERTIEQRYIHFRTANYTLKPLSYWCNYVSDRKWAEDDDYQDELKAGAYRIMAGLSSSCFIYLYLADRIELDELRLNHDGIERALYSHKNLWSFLRRYIQEELDHTKVMNAGQYKKIESHLQILGKENKAIREVLFMRRVQEL